MNGHCSHGCGRPARTSDGSCGECAPAPLAIPPVPIGWRCPVCGFALVAVTCPALHWGSCTVRGSHPDNCMEGWPRKHQGQAVCSYRCCPNCEQDDTEQGRPMNGHSVTSDNYLGATGVRCLKCGAGMVAERCPETLGCHGRTKGTCPTGWQTCRRLRCPECEPEGKAPESTGPKCCQCGKELTLITSGTQPAYRRGDNPKGWYSDGRENWWTCLACYPERKPAPAAPPTHTSGYTQRCPQCETVVAPKGRWYVCPRCNTGWGLPSPACAGCTGEECGEGLVITRDAEKCTGWRPNAKARIDLAAGFPGRRWVSSADSPSPPTPCPERESAGPKCDKCATPMVNVCCPGLAVDGKCEKWVTHPGECPRGWPKRNGRGLCNYHYCPKCEPEKDPGEDTVPAERKVVIVPTQEWETHRAECERLKRDLDQESKSLAIFADECGRLKKEARDTAYNVQEAIGRAGKGNPDIDGDHLAYVVLAVRAVVAERDDARKTMDNVVAQLAGVPEIDGDRTMTTPQRVAWLDAEVDDLRTKNDRLWGEVERLTRERDALRNTLRAVARGLNIPEDTEPENIAKVAASIEAGLIERVQEVAELRAKGSLTLPPGYVVARAEDVTGGGRR